jgi:hypothetical protein
MEKMEGSCSTGQSPQWAIVPVEEEEEEEEGEEEVGFYYNNVLITLVNDTHKRMSLCEMSVVFVPR